MLVAVGVVQQLRHLVHVLGPDEVRGPVEVPEVLGEHAGEFHAAVVDPAGVHVVGAVTARGSVGRGEDLVVGGRLVVGTGKLELALEQADVRAHFPGARALGLEVGGGGPGVDAGGTAHDRVRTVEDEALHRVTHLGVGSAELGVRDEVGLALEHLGDEPGGAHGRIEERLHAVRAGHLGGPVLAGGRLEEEEVLEADVQGAEHGLRLVAEGGLVEGLARRHVREGEQVRDAQQVAAEGGSAVEVILDGSAQDGVQGEQRVVAEVLVQVQEHVGVALGGLLVVVVVTAELAGEQTVGGSVVLFLADGAVVVHPDAGLDVQPVGDVVADGAAQDVPVLLGLEHVAVHGPVGILHGHLVSAPVLGREVTGGVVALEHRVGVQVVRRGHQVQRHERVVVQTAGEHVLLVHADEHPEEAQVELVVEVVGRVAEGRVEAVVVIVRDDALGVGVTGGEIGRGMLLAGGHAERVRGVVAGLEEILDAPGGSRLELAAPGGVGTGLGAVFGLAARQHQRGGEGRVVGVGHVETFLTGAGGEHEDTVRGLVTVQGGGGGAHEGAHVGDVLGIEHGHTVTGQAGAGIDAPGVARRGHRQGRERNAVQDIEGVVGVLDGLRATHDDLGLAAGAGGRLVDLDARDLAREGIDHVGFARDEDLFVQFLDIVGHGLLGALDAEGGDDDALEEGGILLQGDVDDILSGDGHHRIHHSDVGVAELGGVGRNLQRVVSVDVRDRADGRLALDDYACPDQRFTVRIHHGTRDGTRLLGEAEDRDKQ